jgi:hypothetical protein
MGLWQGTPQSRLLPDSGAAARNNLLFTSTEKHVSGELD